MSSTCTPKPLLPDQPNQPQMPVGEDQMSMQRHLKMLQTEIQRKHPNKVRSEILSSENIIPLEKVLDKYPDLRSSTEVTHAYCTAHTCTLLLYIELYSY